MQAGGFLKFLTPLLNSGLPLLKSAMRPLGYLGLNALGSVSDALIHKKNRIRQSYNSINF